MSDAPAASDIELLVDPQHGVCHRVGEAHGHSIWMPLRSELQLQRDLGPGGSTRAEAEPPQQRATAVTAPLALAFVAQLLGAACRALSGDRAIPFRSRRFR